MHAVVKMRGLWPDTRGLNAGLGFRVWGLGFRENGGSDGKQHGKGNENWGFIHMRKKR